MHLQIYCILPEDAIYQEVFICIFAIQIFEVIVFIKAYILGVELHHNLGDQTFSLISFLVVLLYLSVTFKITLFSPSQK